MVRPFSVGAIAFACLLGLASAGEPSTTPAVDLAGNRAFAALGATLIMRTGGSAAAIEFPLHPGWSLGFTAGHIAPLSAQGTYGAFDRAIRLTGRWQEDDGWILGAALSAEMRNETRDGSLGRSAIAVIPQIAFASRLPDIEGMEARMRGAAGLRFPLSDPLDIWYIVLPPITIELAIAVRPGAEVVLGGGSLVGYRAIW